MNHDRGGTRCRKENRAGNETAWLKETWPVGAVWGAEMGCGFKLGGDFVILIIYKNS